MGDLRLAADIGGTHARFALFGPEGEPEHLRKVDCSDHPGPGAAIRAYLDGLPVAARPREASLAVACPVTGDEVRLTNHPWSFSVERTRRELDLDRLVVINDFEALALALPRLRAADWDELRPGAGVSSAPLAVLGPGTGLGVAALVPSGKDWIPLATEGGHRDLAATDDREWAVVGKLAERFGHASCERALSGPGLVNIYEALCALGGRQPERLDAAAVVERAVRGAGACRESVGLFSGWLGAFAGDLALTLGARGGIYLAGGVVPRMGAAFDRERFVGRFLAKGRFTAYLEPIPVRLIVHSAPALLGAPNALERRS